MESIEYYENAVKQGEKRLEQLAHEIRELENRYDSWLSSVVSDRQALDELRAAELADRTEDRLAEMDVWTR